MGLKKSLYIRSIKKDIKNQSVTFTADEVREHHENSDISELQLLCMDSSYVAIPLPLWKRIIERSQIDDKEYISEIYDCDDFAFAFKGAVGRKYSVNGSALVVDYSGGHAYNLILVLKDDGSLDFDYFEPQNDVVMSESPDKGLYQMDYGFIIL